MEFFLIFERSEDGEKPTKIDVPTGLAWQPMPDCHKKEKDPQKTIYHQISKLINFINMI